MDPSQMTPRSLARVLGAVDPTVLEQALARLRAEAQQVPPPQDANAPSDGSDNGAQSAAMDLEPHAPGTPRRMPSPPASPEPSPDYRVRRTLPTGRAPPPPPTAPHVFGAAMPAADGASALATLRNHSRTVVEPRHVRFATAAATPGYACFGFGVMSSGDDPKFDTPLWISFFRVDAAEQRVTLYVLPEDDVPITAEAFSIHGLDLDVLRARGAQPLRVQLLKLLKFLNDSAGGARIVLFGHGERDGLMIKNCLETHGIAPGSLLRAVVMDTCYVAKKTVGRADLNRGSLKKLDLLFKEATEGQELGAAHNAMVAAGGTVVAAAWLWDNLGKPSLSRFVDLYGAFVYAPCERNAARALALDAGATATVVSLTSREATPNAGAGGYFGTGAGARFATGASDVGARDVDGAGGRDAAPSTRDVATRDETPGPEEPEEDAAVAGASSLVARLNVTDEAWLMAQRRGGLGVSIDEFLARAIRFHDRAVPRRHPFLDTEAHERIRAELATRVTARSRRTLGSFERGRRPKNMPEFGEEVFDFLLYWDADDDDATRARKIKAQFDEFRARPDSYDLLATLPAEVDFENLEHCVFLESWYRFWSSCADGRGRRPWFINFDLSWSTMIVALRGHVSERDVDVRWLVGYDHRCAAAAAKTSEKTAVCEFCVWRDGVVAELRRGKRARVEEAPSSCAGLDVVEVAHDEELSLPTIGARVIVADHIKGVPILRCWACGDCNSRLTHYFDTPSNPEAVLWRCADASHMRADRVGTTPG